MRRSYPMALSFSKWWHLRIDRWFPESWPYMHTWSIETTEKQNKNKQRKCPNLYFIILMLGGGANPLVSSLLWRVSLSKTDGFPKKSGRILNQVGRSACFEYRLRYSSWFGKLSFYQLLSFYVMFSFRDSGGHTAVLRSWRGRIHTEFSYFSTSCQIIW